MNRVAQIRELIIQEVKNCLGKAITINDLTISSADIPGITIEVPRDKSHGDFACNIALLLAKPCRKSPRDIAQIIVKQLDPKPDWLDKIEIAGPGFLNFTVKKSFFTQALEDIVREDEKYGSSDFGKGKSIMVEFVSANPTGLLHMGNARGAAIGDSLANILSAAGFTVSREYYINDAGTQIENFGKSIEARYLELLGKDFVIPEDGYHGEDIIGTAKNILDKYGSDLMDWDETERRKLFIKEGLDEKIGSIRKTLEDFGVTYDKWFSEAGLHESGAVKNTIEELKEKGLIYEKDQAIWLKATAIGDEKDEVMVRNTGAPTYFAADIAYHKNKFDRGFDTAINIWGADHHGHVARMKRAVEVFGIDSGRLEVLLMQLVKLLKNGEVVKMSKRSGQYVTLSELMEEVGKDAARFFFCMRNPDTQMDFDLDLAKSQSSENPVYYCQYAHARICSLLKLAGEDILTGTVDWSLLKEPAEQDLIRKLADLPEEIVSAARNREPHGLPRYCMDLAGLFHSFYNECRCLVEDEELKKARIGLANCTRIVIRNVLTLIGVSAPERM